jgi:hypothetical protein
VSFEFVGFLPFSALGFMLAANRNALYEITVTSHFFRAA